MSIKNLSFAEKTVLKGAIRGGGSTSEDLCAGFVTGDMRHFTGNYRNLHDAWARLDVEQQQGVIDIREALSIGRHDFNIGDVVVPDISGFVNEFVEWKVKVRRGELIQDWYDHNRGYDDEITEDVEEAYAEQARNELKQYLVKR